MNIETRIESVNHKWAIVYVGHEKIKIFRHEWDDSKTKSEQYREIRRLAEKRAQDFRELYEDWLDGYGE